MLPFNRSDLERLFPENTWQKAEGLVGEGAVMDVNVEGDGRSITGRVRGQRRTPFLTRIKIANGRGGRVRLQSTCTCLVYTECEHAAATLIGLLGQTATLDPDDGTVAVDPEIEGWIKSINACARMDETTSDDVILYLLEPRQRLWRDSGVAQPVSVNVARAKKMRSNAYGRENPVAISNLAADPPPAYITADDQIIGRMLGSTSQSNKALSGLADSETLLRMLETGRCHWRNGQGPALEPAEARRGVFTWRFDSEGRQRIVCEIDGGNDDVVIIALGEPWYIDVSKSACGPVDTGLSQRVAGHLVMAPSIPAESATVVRQRLMPSADAMPLPEPLKKRERMEIKPIPLLHMHCPTVTVVRGSGWRREEIDVELPLARASFDYAGAEVGWQDGRSELNHVADNRLLVLPRDALAEVQAIDQLNALGMQPLGPTGLGRHADDKYRQDFTFEEDDDDDVSMRWVEFNHADLPRLEADGWRITFSEEYPYRVLNLTKAWDIEINDSEMDWFEIDIGIEIDGVRFALLPVLLDLFQRAPEQMTPEALASYGDEAVYGTLPNGSLLPIPANRLKAIVEALYEQFASARITEDGTLKLTVAEASRLAAVDNALDEQDIVWNGGERLRDLAQNLSKLEEIPQLDPPEGLQATLRPYQLEGMSWLQFLFETSLSGVLADDMGLGKTLQALAHILATKNAGKLTKPALVVAPTSLIPTWRNEAKRFTPDLSMLVLHGHNRADLFGQIRSHDIVLTSYALMLRDRDRLIRRIFSMVILDEAQAIKNPSTKLAKTACELKAEHKLALTGTPMENHLGELWSVFNFLMPGFLGDRETFRRVFRQQIEKDGDEERQKLLARRVRPFLLRRTKEEVATELPPKSEFVREIELSDKQRDLYESVRLAMQSKVRDEIENRGLGRSNIAILEALLKLRQICCDPRLLKDENGDKANPDMAPGNKFELLMEMLEGMVENGRRIIIFSQFVTMLELIEEGLQKRKLDYSLLTGRTRDRETPVREFQEGDKPIFLISLKAGGTGLTLTRADTVIHYDPWWNPAVEAQATDRAHRIGQDKTVFVYKLVTSGTVEEKMLELQDRKRDLVQGILGGVKGGLSFTEEDVAALFAPLPT